MAGESISRGRGRGSSRLRAAAAARIRGLARGFLQHRLQFAQLPGISRGERPGAVGMPPPRPKKKTKEKISLVLVSRRRSITWPRAKEPVGYFRFSRVSASTIHLLLLLRG